MLFEDHAHIVQAGDEARSVDLLRAACPVAEANDVGAVLLQASSKGEFLRVISERDVPLIPVAVISHENDQFAIGRE